MYILILVIFLLWLVYRPSIEQNDVTGDILLYFNDKDAPGGRNYIVLLPNNNNGLF